MGKLFAAAMVICGPMLAFAHGGGLDANGCHTNRKSGDYHCHRAPAIAPPVQPPAVKSGQTALGPDKAAALPNGKTCFVGPRGGTYTITASGKKNYGGC